LKADQFAQWLALNETVLLLGCRLIKWIFLLLLWRGCTQVLSYSSLQFDGFHSHFPLPAKIRNIRALTSPNPWCNCVHWRTGPLHRCEHSVHCSWYLDASSRTCTKPLSLSFADQLQEMMAAYCSSFRMPRFPCVVDPSKDSGEKEKHSEISDPDWNYRFPCVVDPNKDSGEKEKHSEIPDPDWNYRIQILDMAIKYTTH